MTIQYNEGKFLVDFKFDRVLVDLVRRIPGRAYDPKTKKWTIPLSSAKYINILVNSGFQYADENTARQVRDILIKEKDIALLQEAITAEFNSRFPLMGYQKVGVRFLVDVESGLLAYDVGTGKTLMSFAVAEHIRAEKILVVCPNTLKFSWKEEASKWDISGVVIINGTSAERFRLWNSPGKYFVVNYEALLRDSEPFMMDWDLVIADEAVRLKNPSAKITKTMMKLRSKRRIAMTGTPVANNPLDIFSILNWCRPGELGSYWDFQNRYCIKNHWNAIVAYQNLDELATRISPMFIRKTKEEVLPELQPITRVDLPVVLSKEEKRIYEAIRRELLFELKDHETNKIMLASLGNAITRLVRLKQITDDVRLIGEASARSSKLETLAEKLEELGEEKAIVFTQFAEMILLLNNRLTTYNPALIYGEMSAEDRQKEVERFRNDSKCKVLLSTEAGGEGLNLQCATLVFHFDLAWSISKMRQRVGRVHRKGQTKPVFEYFLVAEGTVDEYVRRTLYKKFALSEQLMIRPMGIEDVEKILTNQM